MWREIMFILKINMEILTNIGYVVLSINNYSHIKHKYNIRNQTVNIFFIGFVYKK